MLRMEIAALAAVLLAAGFAFAGEAGTRPKAIGKDTRWLCYYGHDRRVLKVTGYDLLILESESAGELSPEDKNGRICVAYMSIGEAEHGRWYWPDIKDKDWVQETNPDWPDANRVDPRSEEWRELIVGEVAPAIMSLGYDGFFLDNVDNAEILMQEDPAKFRGADDATVELISALREAFPDSVIIANNGLGIVPRAADKLDAMMYEGTMSTWKLRDDGAYSYHEVSPKIKAWLAPRLARVKKAGLTILALEYVDPADAQAYKKTWDAVIRAGNNPFISTRALDTFPQSDTLPKGANDEDEE